MDKTSLNGATVLIKFVDADHPIPVKVSSMDGSGIWSKDKVLHRNLLSPLSPLPLGSDPWSFVPLSQIEWLLVPDKDAR